MLNVSDLWLFTKFVIVGGTGLIIVLTLTYIFTDIFHLWYFISFSISTLVSWTFVFCTNAIITFDAKTSLTLHKYGAFIAGYLLLFCVNATIVFVLTSLVGVFYEISILIGTGITTILTFTFSKTIIFAEPVSSRE